MNLVCGPRVFGRGSERGLFAIPRERETVSEARRSSGRVHASANRISIASHRTARQDMTTTSPWTMVLALAVCLVGKFIFVIAPSAWLTESNT